MAVPGLILGIDLGLELLEAVLEPVPELVVGSLLLTLALLKPRAGRSRSSLFIVVVAVFRVLVLVLVEDG